MKFNFEKIKDKIGNVVKTGALIAGISSASSISPTVDGTERKFSNELNNSIKIEVNEVPRVGGDPKENIHYQIAKESTSSNMQEDTRTEDDKILYEKIKNLEKPFSTISETESRIEDNSIVIITENDLDSGFKDSNSHDLDSVLDNKYITDEISSHIINDPAGVKIFDRSPSMLAGLKLEASLEDQGLMDQSVTNRQIDHIIPEFYFITNQNIHDSTIVFNYKIFSTKKRKVVSEKSINYEIPKGEAERISFVDDKMSQDIAKNIKDFLDINKK